MNIFIQHNLVGKKKEKKKERLKERKKRKKGSLKE